MSPTSLLATLQSVGIALHLDGEVLRYSAPRGVLTSELRQEIRAGKGVLIETLKLRQLAERWWERLVAVPPT